MMMIDDDHIESEHIRLLDFRMVHHATVECHDEPSTFCGKKIQSPGIQTVALSVLFRDIDDHSTTDTLYRFPHDYR